MAPPQACVYSAPSADFNACEHAVLASDSSSISLLMTRHFTVTDLCHDVVVAGHQQWCEQLVRSIECDHCTVVNLTNDDASSSNDAEGGIIAGGSSSGGARSWPKIVSTVKYCARGRSQDDCILGGRNARTRSCPAVQVVMVTADGQEFDGPHGRILGQLVWTGRHAAKCPNLSGPNAVVRANDELLIDEAGNYSLHIPIRDVMTLGLQQYLKYVKNGLTIHFSATQWTMLQDWEKGDVLPLTRRCQGFKSTGVMKLPETLLWDAFRNAMPVDERSIGAQLKIVVAQDYVRPTEQEVVNRKRTMRYGHTQKEWTAIKMRRCAELETAIQEKAAAKKHRAEKKAAKAAAQKLRAEKKAAKAAAKKLR